MKLDVTRPLTDLDGKTLPVADDIRSVFGQISALLAEGKLTEAKTLADTFIGQTKPMTFRQAAMNALMGNLKGDESIDGAKKFALYDMADRINKSDVVELDTGKDCELLKERIGKAYGPAVVGPCFVMLNADDTPAKKSD